LAGESKAKQASWQLDKAKQCQARPSKAKKRPEAELNTWGLIGLPPPGGVHQTIRRQRSELFLSLEYVAVSDWRFACQISA
jgi:hypothetical protein